MVRWYLYRHDERQGQFGSWQRALGAVKTISESTCLIVEFIADGFVRVQASGETYHVKREAVA